MSKCKRTMAAVAAVGILLVTGAGVASASESADSGAPQDDAQPNCMAAMLTGAMTDPATTLTGTLKDPGAALSGTMTCMMSFS